MLCKSLANLKLGFCLLAPNNTIRPSLSRSLNPSMSSSSVTFSLISIFLSTSNLNPSIVEFFLYFPTLALMISKAISFILLTFLLLDEVFVWLLANGTVNFLVPGHERWDAVLVHRFSTCARLNKLSGNFEVLEIKCLFLHIFFQA